MKFMLTFVIVCYAFFAQSQHLLNWSKYDNFSLVEDKGTVYPFWNFEIDVLPPIKESKADMEIRCFYFQHVGARTIFTMQ